MPPPRPQAKLAPKPAAGAGATPAKASTPAKTPAAAKGTPNGAGPEDGGASSGRDTTGAKAFKRVKDDEWLGAKGSMSNHYEDTFGQG